jgi:formyltetrahydrofolate synthetase
MGAAKSPPFAGKTAANPAWTARMPTLGPAQGIRGSAAGNAP